MNKLLATILFTWFSVFVLAQDPTDGGMTTLPPINGTDNNPALMTSAPIAPVIASDTPAPTTLATPTQDPDVANATANATANNTNIVIGQSGNLSAPSAVFGIINIISGLVMVFLGHRLFKPILFISGFYFGANLAFVALQKLEYSQRFVGGSRRDIVYLIVCLLIGAIFGGLVVCLWKLGFILLGVVLGYGFSLVILIALRNVITSSTAQTVIIVVCVVAGGILIHFFEKQFLIVGTSTSGAFSVFTGLDVFAKTGLIAAISVISDGQGSNANIKSKWVYMLAGAIILAVIGILFQFYQLRASKGVHEGLAHRDQLQNEKQSLPMHQNQQR